MLSVVKSCLRPYSAPLIKNWPSGKLSFSFVSGAIKISIEPLICSLRIAKLFLWDLTFRCPNINLLILLIRIFLRDFLTSDRKTVESSDAPFSYLKIFLSDLKFQLPSIKFSKFFANRVLTFYSGVISLYQGSFPSSSHC